MFHVALIERPADWQPASPDDVPSQPGVILETLGESAELLPAVRQAIEYNEGPSRAAGRWAVVVEPGSLGRTWRNARLCTPLTYKVAGIWWPAGWEPQSPLDVPNCVWRAQGQTDDRRFTYPQAVASVRGLNQQSMDHAASLWYVVLAVEYEPVSQSVSYDPAGTETTVEVRRLHVIRPEPAAKGDCTHCPAHSFDCAKAAWQSLEQLTTTVDQRNMQG